MAHLLVEWGCPTDEVTYYLRSFDYNHDGRISYDEFHSGFRPVWRFCFHCIKVSQEDVANRRDAEVVAASVEKKAA